MADTRALRTPLSLNILTGSFLLIWSIIAVFPLFWIAVMSFRVPIDALSSNPGTVLFGPRTRALSGGLSVLDLVLWIALLVV